MKIGRPEKYSKDNIDKLGEELIKFMKRKNEFWLKDFCIAKGFPSEYLTRFSKKSEEFCQSLKKAKDIQESKFVKMGLSKKSNPAFVIFALKNTSNWRDKQETRLCLNSCIILQSI